MGRDATLADAQSQNREPPSPRDARQQLYCQRLLRLSGTARGAAGGRPVWLTKCDIRAPRKTDEHLAV
jgi:hypothetical protein